MLERSEQTNHPGLRCDGFADQARAAVSQTLTTPHGRRARYRDQDGLDTEELNRSADFSLNARRSLGRPKTHCQFNGLLS